MSKKPCIECGEPCDIFPIQLGDFATLTFLRLCDFKCLFMQAYQFMYEIHEHKTFRNRLYELQNDDDKVEVDHFHADNLKKLSKHKPDPKMLSYPINQGILNMFNAPEYQTLIDNGKVVRFKKFFMSKDVRLQHQKKMIDVLKTKLKEAEEDLVKIQEEIEG